MADILKAFALNCLVGGTRLCLHMEWRMGNTVSASGSIKAMEKTLAQPACPAPQPAQSRILG